jgi:CheY-like chemotaxis protein
MVIAFILLIWQSKASYDASVTGTKLVENLSYSEIFIMNIAQRKYNCSILMCFMFVLFPLIYFLDYVHIVNSDYKHAALICLSYFAKSFFCTFIVDFHMDLMDPNTHIVNYEKRANESRRAYLRYVFHEVRVPLNSISMGLHVLQGSNLSSSEKETIVMMREATLFMTATLNDVLSIQKIEQGKLELVKSTTSLTGLFSRVKSSLKGLVVSNEIIVETVIGPNTPKVVSIDPHRIEHVIANLVSNACKFSPKGSTITLDARKVEGNDNVLMFSVTDQGIGMSPEDMTKLFVPFSQIRAHELQEGRGSGVGLAICKEVVELHGGKINVKSKLKTQTSTDHGSTFYFTITYEDSTEDCEQDDSEEDGVQKTLSAVDEAEAIEKWKILVVDDVRSNRKILSLLLNKRGISNDQAENGVEALEMIEKFKYDLVITDQIMPKMNGIVLAAELRKRKYPNIIVGLTGNALDEEIVDFIEAGVDIVMTKPLKYAQLEKLIQFMLKYGTESVQKDIRIEEKSGIKSEKLLSLRQVN